MTLEEIKKRIFPAIYKTRNGRLVEITDFAFQGHFLGEENRRYIWNEQMNFIEAQTRHEKDLTKNDLIEIIKAPTLDPNRFNKIPRCRECKQEVNTIHRLQCKYLKSHYDLVIPNECDPIP